MAYSFRIAYESGAFLQKDLISHERFASDADKRGIEVPLGSADRLRFLEDLDRKGILCPIAFTVSGNYESSTYHALLGRPDLVFREEQDFRTWSNYAWRQSHRNGSRKRVIALYSPWQLIVLHQALKHRYFRIRVDDFLAPKAGRDRLIASGRRLARPMMESLSEFDATWRPLLFLLVRIQNRYWPFVGSYSSLLDRFVPKAVPKSRAGWRKSPKEPRESGALLVSRVDHDRRGGGDRPGARESAG